MLNGDGNENGITINISNEQKNNNNNNDDNNFARAARFLYISLPLLCTISTESHLQIALSQ